MRALTCAFLTLGLVLATCAGCGYESQTKTKKPSSSTPTAPPGTGAGDVAPETGYSTPATPADTPDAEEKKEAAEEKPAEKPAEDKPTEDKKTEDTKPEEGK